MIIRPDFEQAHGMIHSLIFRIFSKRQDIEDRSAFWGVGSFAAHAPKSDPHLKFTDRPLLNSRHGFVFGMEFRN
jgi:hypothetical protein